MKKLFFLHLAVALGLLLTTFVYLSFLSGVRRIPISKALDSFPYRIGSWRGADYSMEAKVVNILGVEDYLMRSYTDPSGGNLQVYVGYYESQSEGDIIHSPRHCLPGAGWQPVYAGKETVELNTGSRDFVEINKYVVQKGMERELVLYWYHSRGRVVASEYADKLYLIWDSIFKKRSDGALIRFSSRINPDESRTQARMLSFIQQFFPVLQQYLPDANNKNTSSMIRSS